MMSHNQFPRIRNDVRVLRGVPGLLRPCACCCCGPQRLMGSWAVELGGTGIEDVWEEVHDSINTDPQ